MEGCDNYGYMGLFECSRDGEPSYQLSLTPYTFEGLDKEIIEQVKTRTEDGWGDRVIMKLLNIDYGKWDY